MQTLVEESIDEGFVAGGFGCPVAASLEGCRLLRRRRRNCRRRPTQHGGGGSLAERPQPPRLVPLPLPPPPTQKRVHSVKGGSWAGRTERECLLFL